MRDNKRIISFDNDVSILSYAGIAGPKEKEGPLGMNFDFCIEDSYFGEDTWEKAESKLLKCAVEKALQKANIEPESVDIIYAGDLLNQCVASAFGIIDLKIPFSGIYGACSTMALSLINAAISVNSGAAKLTIAATSSHFCSAERQYRFPLEYGGVRPPTSQWTVTGSGAVLLSKGYQVKLVNGMLGRMIELGITDANNMGAAMAPAAADTICDYLKYTNTSPKDYDLILTGDLGSIGSELLYILLKEKNIDIKKQHKDCGNMIYNPVTQDVHAGGSGCGCSASVLCSYILKKMEVGALKKVLFCATGALMSPTTVQQGESIAGIAHIVYLKST